MSNLLPLVLRLEGRTVGFSAESFWALDPSIGNRLINARAETLIEKSSFKCLVQTRRWLVPANGFYEWQPEGSQKFPMRIHLKNREPFAFAGMWNSWRNPQLPEDVVSTFTIITTDANTMLKQNHNRMPVIYNKPMGRQWLEGIQSSMMLDAVLLPRNIWWLPKSRRLLTRPRRTELHRPHTRRAGFRWTVFLGRCHRFVTYSAMVYPERVFPLQYSLNDVPGWIIKRTIVLFGISLLTYT